MVSGMRVLMQMVVARYRISGQAAKAFQTTLKTVLDSIEGQIWGPRPEEEV